MKRIAKVFSLTALMVGMSFGANAQFRQSVFLDLDLPTGGFASSVSSSRLYTNAGHNVPLGYTEIGKEARFGFGIGYRASYRFDVGVGMVAPFVQADFLWNTISGDLSEEYSFARADHKPTYFNIPIQIGVTYLYDELWNDITPYAEFGLGADIFFITSEGACHWTDATTGNKTNSLKYSYKPSTTMAYTLGLGAYFGDHVSAGLYYYGLGKHSIDYTSSTYNSLSEADKTSFDANPESRSIGAIALRIGFHF